MARGSMIGLDDRSNIPLTFGGGGSGYNARAAGARIHIPVGVPAAKRTVKEILFPVNAEGTSTVGGRTDAAKQAGGTWYANGNGGTLVAQLCTPKANGDPDLTNVLGSETFAFAARWNLMATRWGGSSFRQVIFASLNNTVVMAEGGTYWLILANSNPEQNANYISLNFSDMRGAPASGAPNQSNSYATPNATGAVAGLDGLEVVAQTLSTTEPRTWTYAADTRNANQIAWCATTWTSNSATPFYGFAPWTGGNVLVSATETTPPVPTQALNIPITGVTSASPGGPGTITVTMWDTATGAAVAGQTATASITQSGFRSANLSKQIIPTKLTHYFKVSISGNAYSSALEGGLEGPYGVPPHSPLGFDFNFRTAAADAYSTITKLGVDLQPSPWLTDLAAAPPPLDTPAGPPAKPATPTAVSLDASARVNLSPLNTEADMASYILQRRLTP